MKKIYPEGDQKRITKEERKRQVFHRKIIGGVVAAVLVLLLSLLILSVTKKQSSEAGTKGQNSETEQGSQTQLSSEEQSFPDDESAPVSAEAADTVSEPLNTVPAAEDGSGDAGLLPMDEQMRSLSTQAGLISDGQNAWYTPDLIHCYYNGWFTAPEGVTYHFDASGLADYGWKLIGGKGCYFDENAVYQPEADPNKLLAFTFDDGPSHGMDELLDLCEETGARVTFFMIGKQVENGGAVLPRIIQDRCEVGNHSNTHTQMTTLSTEECAANFGECDSWIRSYSGGIEADAVRFPYGDFTAEEAAAVGKPSIMWSVDSLDWDLLEAQPVIDTVLSQITEGDIILMHDRYESTVEACRYLFPTLIAQGYQLVTVKELAAAKGYELEAGKTYYGFCQEYIEQNRVWQ